MNCFLSSVRVIVISTICHFESIRKHRNIICHVGTRVDFSGRIVNPRSRKSATVALIFLKQIPKVSPRNSESSIYLTNKYPFDLKYLNKRVKSFLKTLTVGKNSLGRTIY